MQRLMVGSSLTTVRRGERIVASRTGNDFAIIVIAGLAAIESRIDNMRRQIHAFAFPRELACLKPFEAMPELAITAVTEMRFCKVRPSRFEPTAPSVVSDSDQARTADALANEQFAFLQRQVVHAATLGRLTGEERVATLLLELAHVNGRARGGEIVFDLSMTRSDMADYLDLNADTLSRVLSRLKTASILALDGRSTARIANLASLEGLTPLAGAVGHMRKRQF